jgi:hypothetical protein
VRRALKDVEAKATRADLALADEYESTVGAWRRVPGLSALGLLGPTRFKTGEIGLAPEKL